MEKDEIDNQH